MLIRLRFNVDIIVCGIEYVNSTATSGMSIISTWKVRSIQIFLNQTKEDNLVFVSKLFAANSWHR